MQKPIDCSPEAQVQLLFNELHNLRRRSEKWPGQEWEVGDPEQLTSKQITSAVDCAEIEFSKRFQAWHRIQDNGSTIRWDLKHSEYDACPFCLHEGLEGGVGLVRSCTNCKTHISKPGEQVWKHCVADPYEDLFIRHHGQVDRNRYSCDECKGWATLDNGSACPKCNPRGGE
tara:strand:- start:520 stop:1035 length:516 start_codon:yes stop_codon:yes gene_type:complete